MTECGGSGLGLVGMMAFTVSGAPTGQSVETCTGFEEKNLDKINVK